MTRDQIISMAREAGFQTGVMHGEDGRPVYPILRPIGELSCIVELERFASLVAAAEREAIAVEFDRRAVLSDGGPAVGWYEPHEPAEIVRARGAA